MLVLFGSTQINRATILREVCVLGTVQPLGNLYIACFWNPIRSSCQLGMPHSQGDSLRSKVPHTKMDFLFFRHPDMRLATIDDGLKVVGF